MTQDEWKKRFREKFVNNGKVYVSHTEYTKCEGSHLWTSETVESFIESLITKAKEELLQRIKYKLETMVFNDTGEDKTENIMNFRREQSEFIDSLK